MISSFFNKAKPVHLVIVCLILLLVFITAKYYNINKPFALNVLIKQTSLLAVCLSSVFVLDFLVSRNNLTKKNSYKILIFGLFVALLPETILNSKLLLANFFILLALRRILSLRSNKDIKKKLFDASFWICIATLFYFWSILFYVLIIAALILYSIVDIKNWIVPFIGALTVVIIGVSYMIIMDYNILDYSNNLISFSFDFSSLNSKRIVVSATIILSYGVWSLLYFVRHLKAKSKKSRPSFLLIIFAVAIGLLIIAVSPNKNGSEFLFLFAPLSIIVTNYLETISEKWFKEVLLLGLIVTPILILLL
ncbi:MAG TPA: DUF6427 family protein [Flavobacteriaceae bacterium]